MQLLPNDIIIRNYKDRETVWVSQRLVMHVCGVTDEYFWRIRNGFKKSIQHNYKYGDFLPNTGKAWRWGKANGTFYYDFDCLPDRKPTRYRSRFGTKHELLQAYEALQSEKQKNGKEQIINLIKQQVKSTIESTDIRYYLYSATIGFNQTQATEMATARAWCIWINKQIVNDNFKQLGIYKIGDLYQLGYEHEMAFGSNKEDYNANQITNEQQKIKNNSTKQRVQRDFKPSEWSNLNE